MTKRILRGDHCQCGGCGEYFNSTAAHLKHRTGEYGVDRRCRTPDEMREKGMAQNSGGWWVTAMREDADSRVYGDA